MARSIHNDKGEVLAEVKAIVEQADTAIRQSLERGISAGFSSTEIAYELMNGVWLQEFLSRRGGH